MTTPGIKFKEMTGKLKQLYCYLKIENSEIQKNGLNAKEIKNFIENLL